MGATRQARIDPTTAVIASTLVALLVIAGNGQAPASDAAPPPTSGYSHGAAGSGRNGFGGSIAPSPTMRSWPGTGSGGNGGRFAFIGAHYGDLWRIPPSANNSRGVGYCVMEDVGGEGRVALQRDPEFWDAGEMARAAALMSTFGGDRVVPYGIDSSGAYDLASGEWHQPSLLGGGEYTRRRHVAVNFGVKMLVEDVSPSGAVKGLKLARDAAVVDGAGGEFAALRNGYVMAQRLVEVAEAQHAVGEVRLQMVWATPDGAPPTGAGTYPLEVRSTDATGKPVGFVPVVGLSEAGIDGARTVGALARVNRAADTPDDAARWTAADALGWPTFDMAGSMAADARFGLATNPFGADVTDAAGVARFDVTTPDGAWELAFHTQAPTADVSLYSGTGIQGQITWSGPPQSASVRVVATPHPPPPPPPAPVVGSFAVRKVLDARDVQGGRDMSGFEFDVTDTDGVSIGRLTTGTDGRTAALEVSAGTYTIAEISAPPWASGLSTGAPVTFDFDPDRRSDDADHHGSGIPTLEVAYVNVVPAATISTSAIDRADGDRVVDLRNGDATIVDTVAYTGLVPGTEYTAIGELMVQPTDSAQAAATGTSDTSVDTALDSSGDVVASSTVAMPPVFGSGIFGSTTFVPNEPVGRVEVRFVVPADSPLLGQVVVVYQRLMVAASRRVIAVHADPAASTQTIRFVTGPSPTSTVPTTTIATTIPTSTTIPATSTPTTTIAMPTPTTIPTTIPEVPAVEPPPSSTTSTSSTTSSTTAPAETSNPPAPSTPARLPRTGPGDGQSLALGGLALVLLGVGLLLAIRSAAPFTSSDAAPRRRPHG